MSCTIVLPGSDIDDRDLIEMKCGDLVRRENGGSGFEIHRWYSVTVAGFHSSEVERGSGLSSEDLLDEGILIIDMPKLRIGSALIAHGGLWNGAECLATGTA